MSGRKSGVLVQTKELTKIYRSGAEAVRAVRDVTVDLPAGKIISIEGPSGSGKTTFLHLIGGLEHPTAGDIIFDGKPLGSLAGHDRQDYLCNKVGFIFQSTNLSPYLTAAENVMLPLIVAKKAKKAREERVRELLGAVGIVDRSTHFPRELSGGEKQRVAIAIALANNPQMVLADEPTGELDIDNTKVICKLFQKINQTYDTTIILSTHNPVVAETASIRYQMMGGRLVVR
ncbi:MAG: ABC transporter ATP-binding protein [Candidatus Odinarchaeota archaeon]